jgi:5'-nucleotidase
VTAWEYAYGVGILNVSFDSEGVATKAEGGIVLPVEGPYLRKDTAGAWSPVVESEMAELMAFIAASPILRERAVDAGVEAVIKPYRDEVERMKVAPIGSVAITMPFERIPAAFSAGSKPTGSYAAFVVAKAFREANPRIDVAIQNSGGVRTHFLEGVFTVGDAIKALPFANTVVMLDLTGEEIVKVLNQAAHYALNSGSTGAFPYSAGLRFDVDLKGAEGKVVFNVDVQDRASGVWAPIDLKATYTVSTNSFTALGKDNYLEFGVVRGADPAKFEDTYINYSVPLKEYVEKLPGKVLPALDPDEYCLKSVR